MPHGKDKQKRTRTPITAVKSSKRAHSKSEDTAESSAGTSHGQVAGVDGATATSAKKKPKPKFNFGKSRFSDIKATDHFVDKTKIIEVLFDDSPYVLITKPRRFGKSTVMNMVQEFVETKVYLTGDKAGQEILRSPENDRAFPEMNLRLFEDGNFEISKWDEFSRHRGKYPTIYLNFQSVDGEDFLKILLSFRKAIRKAFDRHSYLLRCEDLWSTEKEPEKFNKKKFQEYRYPTPTEADIFQMIASSSDLDKTIETLELLFLSYIEHSLTFLAEVLHKHFNHGIYLLIDEYDTPVNNTIFENKDLCKKVNRALTNLFKNLLKEENGFIDRALITGISYISSVGLSGVNNVEKHMFLRGGPNGNDKYEAFYGITEMELDQLITKFTEKFWNRVEKLSKEEVKSYYSGYQSIGLSRVKIYPIWSVVHALQDEKLGPYWEQSGIMESAKFALNIPIVLLAIEKLMAQKLVQCEIPFKLELSDLQELSDVILKWEESRRTLLKPDIFLSFLLQQGYLTYVNHIDKEIFEVKIPNRLIEGEFRKLMKKHFGHDYDKLIANVTTVLDEFPNDPDKLSDEIVKRLISSMQEAFEYVSNKWHRSNEDVYHCVIFHCLCKSLKYTNCTELTGSKGRLDIAFMFGGTAVIIEVKYCKTALTAFQQAKNKNYAKTLRKSVSDQNLKCLCMGLNVDANNKVSIAYGNADNPGAPHEVSL